MDGPAPQRGDGRNRWSTVTAFGVVVAPPLRLTLAYATVPPWVYPLFPGPSWLALGRFDADDERDIRVPAFAVFVPRGVLVLLRYWDDGVTLQRSTERPEYTVWLDRQPLVPQQRAPLAERGLLGYGQSDTARTELSYWLDEGRPDDDR